MEVIGVLPKLLTQFWLTGAEFQRFEDGRNYHRRQCTRINVRMRVKAQILQRLSRTGNKTSERAERFRERAVNKRDLLFYPELLSRSTAIVTARKHRVGFVNENARVVRLCHSQQFPQIPEVAIHRVNALDDHELAPPFLTAQRCVQRRGIVVLEFLCATPGQHSTIAKTKMRAVVQNR